MAHGAWRMAHGAWRMAHGAWGMAHGAWRMAHDRHSRVRTRPREPEELRRNKPRPHALAAS
eukprot:968972-Prymnesium_polylepis.1